MKYLKFFLLLILGAGAGLQARTEYRSKIAINQEPAVDLPYATLATHNVGKISMTVTNMGILGNGSLQLVDPYTGERAVSLSYPQGYGLNYLDNASLWVGAMSGSDTLVSSATGMAWDDIHEFWPDKYPEGKIIYRSNKDPEAPEYDSSISNQDYIAVYFDTLTDAAYTGFDYYTGQPHRPLGIKITQSSYAWGYDYAEDFIIFDYAIANVGEYDLDNAYIGLYFDLDAGKEDTDNGDDDICGFKKAAASKYLPDLIDTINIVWGADNNGDPNAGGNLQGLRSPSSVIGLRVLRTPGDGAEFSFNWWTTSWIATRDWGPRKYSAGQQDVRRFHGVLGTPYGDNDKYYMMAQREFDYDQVTTGFDHSGSGWLPPPDYASDISSGEEIRYLISCGPFDFRRGDILPFTVAVVGGQDFYAQERGTMGYSKWRDFGDLALNAVWADWVFDNPGVDTDGDGNFGKAKIKVYDSTWVDDEWVPTYADTVYYAGDGIPDFRGANPPPAPKFTVTPNVNEFQIGELELCWNGRLAETTPDQFSQRVDFEGYRVYIGISNRDDDFSLVSSYDIENYDRWEYHAGERIWIIQQDPFSILALQKLYGDDFEPLEYYDPDHMYRYFNPSTGKDVGYYFTRHDWNQSNYSDTTLIHKIYPEQPYPSTLNLDSARMFYPEELTDAGELKYFEYRFVFRDLLPSQQYFVGLTTFDHGYPARALGPQESSPSMNYIREYAQNSSTMVEELGLNVIVYPNPYRVDANYGDRFEGWDRPDLPKEYNRAIHFTNLPHKCTIRIFTLDGDLVREIDHDYPPGANGSMHEKWDLISRNTMMTVSGIYYYSVESAFGNQIGKIVIIR